MVNHFMKSLKITGWDQDIYLCKKCFHSGVTENMSNRSLTREVLFLPNKKSECKPLLAFVQQLNDGTPVIFVTFFTFLLGFQW